jgi:hypothetical protein
MNGADFWRVQHREHLLFQPICPDGDAWSTTVSVIGVFFSDTTFWRVLQTSLIISYYLNDYEGYCISLF